MKNSSKLKKFPTIWLMIVAQNLYLKIHLKIDLDNNCIRVSKGKAVQSCKTPITHTLTPSNPIDNRRTEATLVSYIPSQNWGKQEVPQQLRKT
jgi:hypothetical protein